MRGIALRGVGVVCALALSGLVPTRSAAFEFLDGRLEIHGFYEAQIRTIASDFNFGEWELSQFWNVLNLEIEADIAPDGVGPFDVISGFARIEVRYDCVWTSACSAFDGVASYAEDNNELTKRLMDARRTGYAPTNFFEGDTRRYTNAEEKMSDITTGFLPDGVPLQFGTRRRPLDEVRKTPILAVLWNQSTARGFDGKELTGDEPGLVYFADYQQPFAGSSFGSSTKCGRWGVRQIRGSANGEAVDVLPLEPECQIFAIGLNADKPNPFDPRDRNFFDPSVQGMSALPFRPAPELSSTANVGRGDPRSRGLFYPSLRLRELLQSGDLERGQRPFRRSQLAWNHGLAQENEKELKELYFDIEMFDSRLWLRAGFQTIVWGKTELFRNQDQLNPQDLALASLPSLEESRLSLWALRGVWSFYDVGPFQDVRVEIAVNYDQHQGNDFGTCGEPYTVLAACAFRTGEFVEGMFGVGLVGAVQPPNAWDSWSGIEVGGRIEWRWDRFSFAVTDFYGHQDFPWIDRVYTYSRNVDPLTGRPREAESRGRCKTGRNEACLTPGEAVSKHHANQQLFALVCALSLPTAPALDPTACATTIWSSPNGLTLPDGSAGPFVVVAIDGIVAGDTPDGLLLGGVGTFTDRTLSEIDRYVVVERQDTPASGLKTVTVPLNRDVADGPVDHPLDHPLQSDPAFPARAGFYQIALGLSLSDKLSDEQEALLGCGAFYQTTCDLDGLDLLNAEASALYSAWPTGDGTGGDRFWDTTDARRAQPGTRGFMGTPECTRYQNGQTFVLPGCRGPGDRGYDPREDGTTDGLLHPFTGQEFKSEMAALSWNFLMFLSTASTPPAPQGQELKPSGSNALPATTENFLVDDPFRKGGCSYRHPQLCTAVKGLNGLAAVGPRQIRAGGNGSLGRRSYLWHGGSELVTRVQKTNILGFSMDFAEDYTKSNWGLEFTWVPDLYVGDTQSFDGVSQSDFFRLTISVDRPTFVNFLNANRTFFFNTQWFVQYASNHSSGFTGTGPFQVFFVVSGSTGYFQDRLLASTAAVYFFGSNSFGLLPSLTYRFTENFSATFGAAWFGGRTERREGAINPAAPPVTPQVGRGAYQTFVDNGLSVVRERDELFLRIKYTF